MFSVLSSSPITTKRPANKARGGGLTSPPRQYISPKLLQDYPYLTPIIKEIESESRERGDLESMVIQKKQANKVAEHGHESH